jgi:hypothetical protein
MQQVLVVPAAGAEEVYGQFGTQWNLVLADNKSGEPLTA